MKAQFIGIEGGGTKFICAYGSSPQDLHERKVFSTGTPQQTMKNIADYVGHISRTVSIKAIGIGMFGPLDLNFNSPTYGYMLTPPKEAWQHYDLLGEFKRFTSLPIAFDTDVNAAALGEFYWGAAKGLSDFIYITIGTGIGGGIMSHGNLIHGALHPEMGHILVSRDEAEVKSICSFHDSCLEGLASGPALKARWKVDSALDLPSDHIAWDIESRYLGLALFNYSMMVSPQRIILGGGVMRQPTLLPKIRKQFKTYLNNYVSHAFLDTTLEEYIVKPELNENAGVCGALGLARNLCHE